MSQADRQVLIKRYASRRLYNTETSEYVTLQQVAEIIRSGRDVRIEDFSSGQDLTRQHLIQIIAEQESSGQDVLPIELLFELVRTYSRNNAGLYPEFLKNSLETFHAYQNQVLEGLGTDTNPQEAFGKMWKQNIGFMETLMGGWMKQDDPSPGSSSSQAEMEDENPPQSEMDAIRQQLANLQNRMDKMQ